MRSWLRRAAILLAAPLLLTPLCIGGCRTEADKKWEVALIMKTMSNPFFISMEKGAREAEKELDVIVRALTPEEETDIQDQIGLVEDMIAKKVDAILIAPAGSKEIVPSLVKAKQAGVVVINLDNRVDPDAAAAAGLELDAYVGADNEQGGFLAGDELAKMMGKEGTVAMLEGIPGVDNAEARKRGFEKAMAQYPGIKIVQSQSAHWKQEEALDVMQDILQNHPDLDGLFCANDMMALGAIQAIEDAGKTGQLFVASYDNLEAAQQAIMDDKLHITIEQHPDIMGKIGVQYAVRLLEGKKLPHTEKFVDLEVITKPMLEQTWAEKEAEGK
ncbi:MAG: substrate-binding domain-containing protein [Armatimonadota bacterium]